MGPEDTVIGSVSIGELASSQSLSFRRPIASTKQLLLSLVRWVWGVNTSALIIAILLFIVINFYIFSSIVTLNSFFYSFLLLSVLTDGLYILLHLPRQKVQHQKLSFNPAKLTVVIACYNGADVIAETIRQAAVHVPLNQIIVISDASTDTTAQIAHSLGVRVIQNRRNLHKPFSISVAMRRVTTPYVLILDDDTHIGKTFIPTSLLDEGYSAVAFNVLPEKQNSLLNQLQQFEYRQSMQLGKNVRASVGAIGNISGAIGLYRTKDLVEQVTLHSGQFAGEDEQRTMLVHLHSKGKGITYTDSTVLTNPPQTYRQLYKQRAYNWSVALPEMFILYWRILLTPRYHFLLKTEKAYQLYLYLTDPLRMLFFWALFLRFSHFAIAYVFYFALSLLVWLKIRAKVSLKAVLVYPFYSLGLTLCRFIGHFYWIKVKFNYLAKRLYRYVENRHLLPEYALVMAVFILSWGVSSMHFASDMSLLNKIHNNRLNETGTSFHYDNTSSYAQAASTPAITAPADASYLLVPVEHGDTQRAIAYKAINEYLLEQNQPAALQTEHATAYTWLASQIAPFDSIQPGQEIHVDKQLIVQALAHEGQPS